jgi:hypothetical protein
MGKQEETWGFNKLNKSEPWGFFALVCLAFQMAPLFAILIGNEVLKQWMWVHHGSPIFSDKTILLHPFFSAKYPRNDGSKSKSLTFQDRPAKSVT